MKGRHRRYVAVALAALSAAVLALMLREFIAVDSCLDAGGRYNYELERCEFDEGHSSVPDS